MKTTKIECRIIQNFPNLINMRSLCELRSNKITFIDCHSSICPVARCLASLNFASKTPDAYYVFVVFDCDGHHEQTLEGVDFLCRFEITNRQLMKTKPR